MNKKQLEEQIKSLKEELALEKRRNPKFLHVKDEIRYLKNQLEIREPYLPYMRFERKAGGDEIEYKLTHVLEHRIEDNVHYVKILKPVSI